MSDGARAPKRRKIGAATSTQIHPRPDVTLKQDGAVEEPSESGSYGLRRSRKPSSKLLSNVEPVAVASPRRRSAGKSSKKIHNGRVDEEGSTVRTKRAKPAGTGNTRWATAGADSSPLPVRTHSAVNGTAEHVVASGTKKSTSSKRGGASKRQVEQVMDVSPVKGEPRKKRLLDFALFGDAESRSRTRASTLDSHEDVMMNGHDDDDDDDEQSVSSVPKPRRLWPAGYEAKSLDGEEDGTDINMLDEPGEDIDDGTEVEGTPEPGTSEVIEHNGATQPDTAQLRDAALTLSMLPADAEAIRTIVVEKLAGRRRMPLVGYEAEYKKVYQTAEQTVTAGEGNSMLVIGARGIGKTALMDEVLRQLARKNLTDFHVVRLNGFIQTDDKVALREIWRQLGKEMEVEDDGTGKSYADMLSKLLALLSHPAELNADEPDAVAKAVIFVLDEFQLFAQHPRQTLLYNLFDVAQSRKAPIAVFGLTPRIDAAESLEKRVKSRFSHRYVHLSQPKTPIMFRQICKAALYLTTNELTFEEKSRLVVIPSSSSRSWSAAPAAKPPLETWNRAIDALFDDRDFLDAFITPQYHNSKSVPAVLTSLLLPLTLADSVLLPPTLETFDNEGLGLLGAGPQNSNLALLPALSSLSLALLIAAARCTIVHDTDALNFQIAYAEYAALAAGARVASAAAGALAVGAGAGTRVWSREVARGCWEELARLGLVIPVYGSGGGGAGGGGGGEAGMAGREVGEKAMVRVDVALEEILPSCPGMEKAMEKWCRQI